MYSYYRGKRADAMYGNPMLSYENRLISLQASFMMEMGKRTYEYIEMLHRRIQKQEAYENISGFLSWDYGSPKQIGANKWQMHVWQKSQTQYPGGLVPNLFIVVSFDASKVHYEVKAGSEILTADSVSQNSSSSSSLGMRVGEAWETKLTGSVDYGD